MRKILYIGYPVNSYGAPHQYMAALYFGSKGQPVDYLCWGKSSSLPPFLSSISHYIHPIDVNKKGFFSVLIFFVKMVILCHSSKYKFIYVQGAQQTPFSFFACLGISSKRITYHTQDFLEPRRHCFYEFFERHFARRAGRVICNEINRARFMKSYYGLNTLPGVITTALPREWPIPVRDESARQRLVSSTGIKSEDLRLIAVGGGYSSLRCSEQLIQALKLLPENYRLVFTGLSEEGVKALKRHQVFEKAIVTERLSFQDLLAIYALCDVGVLLYVNDGVGNFYQAPGRLTEYMSVGIPFVASACPNFELLSFKYGLGKVCDSQDPRSIANTIQAVCDKSYDILALERERLRNFSKTEFSYEFYANQYLDIYV